MGDQALAIDFKIVLLRFSAKNRMVLEDQARFACSREPLKKQRGGKSTDTAADDYAVKGFASVDGVRGRRIVRATTHFVPRQKHFHGVAIRGAVLADTAVAGPFVIGSEQFNRIQASKQGSAGSEKRS